MVICLEPRGIFYEKTCKVLCSGFSEIPISKFFPFDFFKIEKNKPFSIYSTVELLISSVFVDEISLIKSQRLEPNIFV